MELRPDPNYEGGLVARADVGERLIARTKSFEGAGLVERRPEAVYLRGVVVAEMVANGENLEAIQEKIVKRIDREDGELRRTVTLVDGIIAVVPVYNEKIKKEELLPLKNSELKEEPITDAEALDGGIAKVPVELPTDKPEKIVA